MDEKENVTSQENINEKPVPVEVEGDPRSRWWYVCGRCHGEVIEGEDVTCRHCGAIILWE